MKKIPGKDFTVHTDRFGNKVNVPRGYLYKRGSNQKGIAYHPSSTVKEDAYGQLHEVPKGHQAKQNPDGTLSVAPHAEPPEKAKVKSERKPPKFEKPVQGMSMAEAVRLVKEMARRYRKPES